MIRRATCQELRALTAEPGFLADRKECVRWIEEAKEEVAGARRIEKAVAMLLRGTRKPD